MTIASQAVVSTWEDDTEAVRNGTVPNHLNFFASLNARWGVFDLKAPDELYPGSHFRFINLSPTIPPRAKILSATVTGTAQDGDGSGSSPQGGTLTAIIEIVDKDGVWNVEPKIATPRWVNQDHPTFPVNFACEARTTGATLLTAAANQAGTSPRIALRNWGNTTPVSPERLQATAQALTTVAAGTLGSVHFPLIRTGTRAATLTARVYSVTGGGLPNVLLASSDPVAFNSITTSTALPIPLVTFPFSGANQIAISNATQYIFSLEPDYSTPDASNFIQAVYNVVVTAGSHSLTFGEGRGVGTGNYLAAESVLDLSTVAGSGSVSWSVPQFILDNVYSTPDLSPLVQAYVNDSSYVEGDPFLIRIRPLGFSQLKNRGFKTWERPETPGTVPNVTFDVTWRPRVARVI